MKRVEASNAADILRSYFLQIKTSGATFWWHDATISQKHSSLAHKYNAGPLKSFALAMISRNVEEVMTAFFISQKGFCTNCMARANERTKNNKRQRNSKSKKGDEDQGLEGVDPLRAGD